jgi:hypothetical protein
MQFLVLVDGTYCHDIKGMWKFTISSIMFITFLPINLLRCLKIPFLSLVLVLLKSFVLNLLVVNVTINYSASSKICATETFISTDVIVKCMKNLKLHKAAGLDGIESEHIVYSHSKIVNFLVLLFNSILFH